MIVAVICRHLCHHHRHPPVPLLVFQLPITKEEAKKSACATSAVISLLDRLDSVARDVFRALEQSNMDKEEKAALASAFNKAGLLPPGTDDSTTFSAPSRSVPVITSPSLPQPPTSERQPISAVPSALDVLMKKKMAAPSPSTSLNKRKTSGKLVVAGKNTWKLARLASSQRHKGELVSAKATLQKVFHADEVYEVKNHDRLCTVSGKSASSALFQGDGHRVKGNIRALLRRPEMRTALIAMREEDVLHPRTKRQRAIELMIKSFVHFAKVCLATRGSRSVENQNTLDAAMASWVDQAIFDQRLGREVGRHT